MSRRSYGKVLVLGQGKGRGKVEEQGRGKEPALVLEQALEPVLAYQL